MALIPIIFFGTPDIACPALQALIKDTSFSVDLVVTQPDKPVGRSQELTPPPVKVLAEENNIPVLQPENCNAEPAILDTECDFLVVIAYGQILSQSILDHPRIAPINIHPSLLPKWRGAAPIKHTILAGDTTAGVSIVRMIKKLDAGPILALQEVSLNENTTAMILKEDLAQKGANLLLQTLKNFPAKETEQDSTKATYCHKLTRNDGLVDPKMITAEQIHRKVRALHPWPGVLCETTHCNFRNANPIKILETSLSPQENSFPLSCMKGTTLHVQRVQSPGKKPLDGNIWLSGQK